MNIVQYTPEYTNPEVLESAAGFYIGQRYYDGEMGCHEPVVGCLSAIGPLRPKQPRH